ncbi:protein STRUBBELIG-RECEPTOR FAMILY 4-like isoform X2 [Macadamia integrifolia]|uniref:protein STRUBBELIG-RECEPTOR FAMILY 4-like isoform X2 n=1 Tax=Macadamia integrifolia TaxID=60698 RepID=UPI001C50219C|nr:protein STRUBBELIG-RECEPTOR FAMILY 4-like isoform X2 [Macadamia integrifolia]
MYSSLNSPQQLTGWKSSGGDPCGQSWKGIKCSGSSVTEIKLSGLGLTGSMGYQLSSLTSVTYLNLAGNGFTGSVPYSTSQMADLKELNLGHNQLNGQLSDMFGKLSKLTQLDLSYNSLSGNLPQSIGKLSSLTTLYLQNNQFTGPITVLAGLPLDDLNVANNQFRGWIPNELKDINSIETGGNSWSSGSAPPPPPGTPAIPIRHKHSSEGGKKSGLSGLAIGGIVMGVLVAVVILIALFSRKSSSSSHYLDDEKLSQRRSFTPLVSQELSYSRRYPPDPKSFKELRSLDSSSSIDVKSLQTSPSIHLKPPGPPPSDWMESYNETESTSRLGRRSTSVRTTTAFTLADLQAATGSFAAGRLLGEGNIGRVYRAKYADGKVHVLSGVSY